MFVSDPQPSIEFARRTRPLRELFSRRIISNYFLLSATALAMNHCRDYSSTYVSRNRARRWKSLLVSM